MSMISAEAASLAEEGVVFLFPGQGSQYVGMGKSFYESRAVVRDLFNEASEVSGKDLKSLCFDGPLSVLVDTANVQPAITLIDIACYRVLREEGLLPVAVAGHSLGECAALYAAGVLSFADTMKLVTVRGRAMKEAADRNPGGMTAVFGLDGSVVSTICADVTSAGIGSVEVANQNSPQQTVITGEQEGLRKASELAKAKGAKLLVPLKVSGPWHSRFMEAAREQVREVLAELTLRPPSIPVVANVSAEVYPGTPNDIRERLVEQLVSPVLWSSSMRALIGERHRLFLEVGPGKVLNGLMKDIAPEVRVYSVQDPESLTRFREARASLPS